MNETIVDVSSFHREMNSFFESLEAKAVRPPFVSVIGMQEHWCTYIGARHSNDPSDPQVNLITRFWSSFLESTVPHARVALIEGGKRPVATSAEQALVANGEAGLVMYLAAAAAVRVDSPEPALSDQLE